MKKYIKRIKKNNKIKISIKERLIIYLIIYNNNNNKKVEKRKNNFKKLVKTIILNSKLVNIK
jgi:hypothetical protein